MYSIVLLHNGHCPTQSLWYWSERWKGWRKEGRGREGWKMAKRAAVRSSLERRLR